MLKREARIPISLVFLALFLFSFLYVQTAHASASLPSNPLPYLSNDLVAAPGIILVQTSSNVSFTISNVVANLGNGYTSSQFQKDTYFVVFANTVTPPQQMGSFAGRQCQSPNVGYLDGWTLGSACWFSDPPQYSSCNSNNGGTCTIFNFTNNNDWGSIWQTVNHYVNYCAYYSTGGTPSSAQLIQCIMLNITKYPEWSYGLELVPSVVAPQQFREGSTILIKMAAASAYTNPKGFEPLICLSGDLCYIAFGGLGSAIQMGGTVPGGNLGADFLDITTDAQFLCNGKRTPSVALYDTYTTAPTVQQIISGFCNNGHGGVGYMWGIVPSGSSECLSQSCGLLPTYTCPIVYWNYNPSSIEQDACLLTGYTPNTYGNNQNLTYVEPLNTQYLGTGNYLVFGMDYMNYASKLGVSSTMFYAPFFASMWVDCANGYCTAFPTPQEQPLSTNQQFATASTPGSIGVYNSINPNSYAGIACGVYGGLNAALYVFALLMMMLGAVLYAGTNILPGSSRGPIYGYATGFIFVGVIAALVATVSVFALASVNQTSLTNALTMCRSQSPPPPPPPLTSTTTTIISGSILCSMCGTTVASCPSGQSCSKYGTSVVCCNAQCTSKGVATFCQ